MKAKLLLLSSLLTSSLVIAQTPITNGNLESWKDTSFTNGAVPISYSEPTGGMLKSLNKITEFPGPPPVNCFKETSNVHGGNFAARVVSGSVDFLSSPIFIPGALGTITPFFNSTTFGATIGVPFTEKPSKFVGWFKYTSVQGDSAEFSAATTRNVGGVRETLTLAKQIIKFSESSWTYFEADFVELNAGNPDTIIILCVSSAGYDFINLTNCKGKVGSTLFIDDIAFVYENGLKEDLMSSTEVKIFPNPSSDVINVNVNANVNNGQVRFIDASGRIAYMHAFNGNNQAISVSQLASGLYSIVIVEGNNIIGRQSFIKQ